MDAQTGLIWTAHPAPLEFGDAYLCAGADGRMFREMLIAGDARHVLKWAQVAWTMPASALPKPPPPSTEPTT